MQLKNYLTVFDYAVVAGTLLFSLLIGVFYAVRGKKSNNEELLAGGRNMGAIPVAASILVSYLSAITILGYPAEVYSYGTQIFFTTLLGMVTNPIAILMFVRVLYDLKLTSAYKYLELRYDSILVRWGGSIIFILQLLFISGIVLYAPAIAMETMMGIPMQYSVIAIGVCGTVYTSIGGIKAVVWTDVFQFIMIFVGMSAIVIRGVVSSGGFVEMFRLANEGGRLEIVNWTIDPYMRHNTLNFLIGNIFSVTFVCHQPVVQRYCGLASHRDAVKSILYSYVFGCSTIALVILTGIAIFARYANCDPLISGQIDKADQIVPYFVVQELDFIPGMMGLFAAVIFSAVLSTISSTLNSLAAVTWEDFLSKIPVFARMEDFAQACTYKILTVVYGIICVLLSFVAKNFGGIFQSAITVIGTAIGVQGSLFFMGVFFPFVNKHGALAGLLVGLITMTYITTNAILIGKEYDLNPKLPFSVDGCSEEAFGSFLNGTMTMKNSTTKLPLEELDYPEKLFSVSYQLYSTIGGVLTMLVAIFVSVLTKGCQNAKYVRPEYLHPILRPKKMGFTPKLTKMEINHAFEPEPEVMMEHKL